MEVKFDNEIDTLLRGAGRSGEVISNADFDTHLDADEISMFAENAMPEKVRIRAVSHFADCDKCRTILTNTITLNIEAEREAASSAVAGAASSESSSASLPWYKKLFETRNLAFGMGALAVIFAGMIGFLVLQNSMLTGSSDLAQMDESGVANSNTAEDTSERNADGDLEQNLPMSEDTNSVSANNSESPLDPSGENQSGRLFEDQDPSNYSDLKTNAETEERPKRDVPSNQPETPADKNKANDDGLLETDRLENIARERSGNRSDTYSSERRNSGKLRSKTAPRPGYSAPAPPPRKPEPSEQEKDAADEVVSVESETKEEIASGASVASRQMKKGSPVKRVGGKTFTQKDRVWYDSEYRGQSTTNVRRATSSYKKLDSGLRSITDKLSGTVVVVWKSKAYRIQ